MSEQPGGDVQKQKRQRALKIAAGVAVGAAAAGTAYAFYKSRKRGEPLRTDPSFHPEEITIPQMFHRTAQANPDKTVLLHKVEGTYQPIIYSDLEAQVRDFALGLAALGVEPGDRVALLSENRPEWAITDLAVTALGAVNVPLYSTLPPAQVQYMVRDSGARVFIASTDKQLAKALEVRAELPDLQHLVVMDPPAERPQGVHAFAEVQERGSQTPDADSVYTARFQAVKPYDLASIIYTSGTTGEPKGAMLTHYNFTSNAQSAAPLFEVRSDDLFLSFLPLSHVFARIADHYFPLLVGASVAYAESVFTVQTNLKEVRPTIMASVPRLYESIQGRVLETVRKLPEKRRKIFEWALAVGKAHNERAFAHRSVSPLLAAQYLVADRLVLNKAREVTGGRLRFFISGGAPLPVDTARFFTGLGLQIVEGYGLTETSPVISANPPGHIHLGTIGIPVPGVEVKIAEDGEILSRGPHIMKGYWNKQEATAQAIDAEGWFHTGDLGCYDEEGYLRITGRKKDIIVLANGKNVAPQGIEANLKGSPFIQEVALFGDRQSVIVALVIPNFERLRAWAKEHDIDFSDRAAFLKNPQVRRLFRSEIEAHSKGLADYEKVRRFALLEREFSQETGELTPTLKVKRNVVATQYADVIAGLYGGGDKE